MKKNDLLTFEEWCTFCRENGYAVLKFEQGKEVKAYNYTYENIPKPTTFKIIMDFLMAITLALLAIFTMIYCFERFQ